jgi:hypothetical protein
MDTNEPEPTQADQKLAFNGFEKQRRVMVMRVGSDKIDVQRARERVCGGWSGGVVCVCVCGGGRA